MSLDVVDSVGDVATDATAVPMPDRLLVLLNEALNIIWEGIGHAGRAAVRELQQTLADVDGDKACQIFSDFAIGLQEEFEQTQRDPDLLVYGEMRASAADELLARRLETQSVIVDSVLLAHAAPEAVAEISGALEMSAVSESQKERIRAGLAALDTPGKTWAVPCDLLLGGAEGVLWELAEARGIAVSE